MKLYVIGKVTGIEDDNIHEFEYARALLESAGYEVEIPHDSIPAGTPWNDAMRLSIANMLACDGVVRLDSWKHSLGARLESSIAAAIEIPTNDALSWIKSSSRIARCSNDRRTRRQICQIKNITERMRNGTLIQTYELTCGHSRECKLGERFNFCDICGAALYGVR